MGMATFGDADGLGGVTYTAFDQADAMTHILKSPDAVSSVAVQGEDGVDQDDAGRAGRRGAARRRRGDDRRRG